MSTSSSGAGTPPTVVLSRPALERVRVQAGIWQETVAFRMAEQHPEMFPNPPKKRVNRAWNQQRIQLPGAECIAEALGVPLLDLLDLDDERTRAVAAALQLLDATDAVGEGSSVEAERSTANSARRAPSRFPLAVGAALLLLASIWAWTSREPGGGALQVPVAGDGTGLPEGLALLIPDPRLAPVTTALQARLATDLASPDELTVLTPQPLPADARLTDVVSRAGVKYLLQLDAVDYDRYLMVVATLASARSTTQLWVHPLPANSFDGELAHLIDGVSLALLDAFSSSDAEASRTAAGSPHQQAVDGYLLAMGLVEGSESISPAVLDRAFRTVQSATEVDPGFALAHALKCEILARLWWSDDSQPYVRDGARACEVAESLLPDHPYVLTARAMLLARDARPDEGRALLDPAMVQWPAHVRLRLAAADASAIAFLTGGDREDIDDALAQLEAARQLEPDYWAPHFWLGTYRFVIGEVVAAIAAMERAARLNPNRLTLSNLGTLSLCQGKLDIAADTYERLLGLFPEDPLGTEMLGTVNFFRGDFARAVILRRRALDALSMGDTVVQDHRVHGGLAESYRLAGEDELATASYGDALHVLQRDEASGSIGPAGKVAMSYYLARVTLAAGDRLDAPPLRDTLLSRLQGTLEVEGMTPSSHLWAALAFSLLGEAQTSEAHWQAAVTQCPLYAMHPDYPHDS